MKVCHFVASAGLGRGDVFVDLANSLSKEIDLVIVAPRGARFRAGLDHKVELLEYKSRNSRFNPFLLLELFFLFRKINPDAVHTHFAKATGIFCLLNKVLKMAWVATKHNPRKGRIYNRIKRVIAVSDGVAETITHDGVIVIHNGIAPTRLLPVERKEKPFTVLAVGRLEEVKAFDLLIKECSNLSFDFKLQIVGDGSQKTTLLELANRLNMMDRIDFLGYRTDIPTLMQESDVIVVSSHSEGFSLVILEGLFYGNVLISRDVGIAKSILPDEFLVEDYNISGKLDEVYNDYDNFKQGFQVTRQKQGPQYLLENCVQQHLDYYRQMLS